MKTVQTESQTICRNIIGLITALGLEWEIYHLITKHLKRQGQLECGD